MYFLPIISCLGRRRRCSSDSLVLVLFYILFCDKYLALLWAECLCLSWIVANRSDQTTDQDLLSHLLRSLASQASEHGGKNISGILREPPNSLNAGTPLGNSELVSTLLSNGPQGPPGPFKQHQPGPEMPRQGLCVDDARDGEIQTSSSKPCILNSPPAYSEVRDSTAGRITMNNFDLNDTYIDSDDGMEDVERSPVPPTVGTSSLDSHQSSPPQTSGNSDSVSAQSPSSSSGDAQVYLFSRICLLIYTYLLVAPFTLCYQLCNAGIVVWKQ